MNTGGSVRDAFAALAALSDDELSGVLAVAAQQQQSRKPSSSLIIERTVSSNRNLHIAEERGGQKIDEGDYDEEALYNDACVLDEEGRRSGIETLTPPSTSTDGMDANSRARSLPPCLSYVHPPGTGSSGHVGAHRAASMKASSSSMKQHGTSAGGVVELGRKRASKIAGRALGAVGYGWGGLGRRDQDNLTAQALVDSSIDAMIQIDEAGTIQLVNQAALVKFGWSREEFIGSNVRMIVGGGHGPSHDGYIERYLRTGERRVMGKRRRLRALRKDGTEFPIELGLTEVTKRDGRRLFCGFIRDLSREASDLAQMQKMESLTAGLVDSSFDAIFQIDQRGTIQLVNEAAVTQFGWSREEFMGRNISTIVGGGHAARHDRYLANYLLTGEKRVMGKRRELPARRKDGTEFPIELGLTEVRTGDGTVSFCGFVRDLSRQTADRKSLDKMQHVTAGLVDASFDAIFQIDERGFIHLVNQAAVDQFGWSREEFLGQNIKMIVGGEHRRNHDTYLQRYLRTGVKRAMGKRRELTARRKDGSEFAIELGLTEVKKSDGESRFFCGFVRDITRQKKDEGRLNQKDKLTEGIIQASYDAMFAINKEGIIQRVNNAATETFYYSEKEFMGKNISMIMTGGDAKNHDKYLKRYLDTGERKMIGTQREVRGRKKNGTTFPCLLSLAEVMGPDGDPVFVAFIHDISDEKRAVEAEKKTAVAETLLLKSLPSELECRVSAGDDCSVNSGASGGPRLYATVLFADIEEEKVASPSPSPLSRSDRRDGRRMFRNLAKLASSYGLNRVRTRESSIMVTSVPTADEEEAGCARVCHFGLDVMENVRTYNRDNPGLGLGLRVGINTGPVSSRASLAKKHNLWDDAATLASRAQHTGDIYVTAEVADLMEGLDFDIVPCESVLIEGDQCMERFHLKGRKSEPPSSLFERSKSPKNVLTDSQQHELNELPFLGALKNISADFLQRFDNREESNSDREERAHGERGFGGLGRRRSFGSLLNSIKASVSDTRILPAMADKIEDFEGVFKSV